MSGRFVHVPHVHARPPIFAFLNPAGTVWACDCGKRYVLGRDKKWLSPDDLPRYSDDLEGALRFIHDEANRHRRELGLRVIGS